MNKVRVRKKIEGLQRIVITPKKAWVHICFDKLHYSDTEYKIRGKFELSIQGEVNMSIEDDEIEGNKDNIIFLYPMGEGHSLDAIITLRREDIGVIVTSVKMPPCD